MADRKRPLLSPAAVAPGSAIAAAVKVLKQSRRFISQISFKYQITRTPEAAAPWRKIPSEDVQKSTRGGSFHGCAASETNAERPVLADRPGHNTINRGRFYDPGADSVDPGCSPLSVNP